MIYRALTIPVTPEDYKKEIETVEKNSPITVIPHQ